MTVETQTKKVTATGNGSATVFSFSPVVIFATTDLVVTKKTISTGAEETLTEGSGSTTYSVAAATSFPGTGSVTYPASGGTELTSDEQIIMKRVLTLEQTLDLENQGGYDADTTETQLDKLLMIDLQQQDDIDRSVKVPVGVSGFDGDLPTDIASKASYVLTVNSAGDGFALATSASADATIDSFWVDVLDDSTLADSIVSLGGAAAIINALGADSLTRKNFILNGDGRIAQRTTTFTAASTPANNDDTPLLDRWFLLSDGNDVVDMSQDTSVRPDGAYSSIKLLVATANKKFGIFQPLEARDAASLRGKNVTLSFQARTTTGAVIENIRAAVVSWNGTADSITSDIISAWAAEGTNPTLATNWTVENTATNIAVTADAFATHSITNISVDTSGMTNLGVFIWVDDTDAEVNDVLNIARVKLEIGSNATEYNPDLYQEELEKCQRFCYVLSGSSAPDQVGVGQQKTTTTAETHVRFPISLHKEPSFTVVAVGNLTLTTGAPTAKTVTSASVSDPTKQSCLINTQWSGASGAAGDCANLQLNAGYIIFDAEM
tara:strand:- start:18698 stop:20350 length:1653 start_codon:yes stop_codon:yes gene_type:complete